MGAGVDGGDLEDAAALDLVAVLADGEGLHHLAVLAWHEGGGHAENKTKISLFY